MSTSSAPDLSQRQKCYTARDNYYKCLKENSSSSCQELKEAYDKLCLASWVKYFDRKQVFEQYKKKLAEEGFQEKK